ncbi:DUF2145 domain-containing protein [Herbaspirillum sp. LeCh32-8]|uniref:DUF2145 domain-containing protein n=1 Tax=Herbaspirillum sp. LeCh32-8 TaxID=2821356 RepID=UPI001AE8210B|nr:DUF2145 domain-containing protein [Herbaspirillum sp. LeCh32-8]MBP0598168.1 DUF2145 domain-containing protein [Herbaspirillum sp. LeCh32-8]
MNAFFTSLRRARAAFLMGIALAMPLATHAGQTCERNEPRETAVRQQLDMAVKAVEQLNASGAEVVVIGRVGQDLSKYGQRYSHLGFAYRDGSNWYVVHKLNECGTAQSNIYEQGMGQFFMDDPFQLEAYVSVPRPEIQSRLRAAIRPDQATSMHDPRYNMLAYPWATRYQQSNQWVDETLAHAMEPQIATREQAQAWLKFKGYQPAVLNLGPMTRLGSRMFKANIAFDDHPNEKRFADKIETTTADSVFAFLQKAGIEERHFVIRP